MTTTPPFSAPYTTIQDEGHSPRIVHTLVDGTTRTITSGSEVEAIRARKISASTSNPSAASNGKAEAKIDLPPGNKRVLLFLDVPYSDKDEAKRVGAKWDSAARKWFVPHGLDVNLFSRWWPDTLKQLPELLK
jgi:23S rRNA A2030 N6-methylase RlmJ